MRTKDQFIWGINPVKEALKANQRGIQRIYVTKGRQGSDIAEIKAVARANSIEVIELSRQELDKITKLGKHQGVAAKANALPEIQLSELLESAFSKTKSPLFVLLDCIEDPRNLGAIVRSGLAFGIDGLIYPKDRSADISSVAIKAAAGAVEYVPVVKVTNLVRAMEQMKETGVWLAGTDAEAENPIWAMKMAGPLALVIGGEGKGLRRLVKEKCDFLVSIPIIAPAESLNASVAAAVCLYEIHRQRSLVK